MKTRYKLGDVYRYNDKTLTVNNVIIRAGYHYDDISYDVEIYREPENLRKKFRNISEGAISEVIDMHQLRLAGDIRPIKKIRKLEIQ